MNTPSFDDILDEHRPRIVFGAAHAEWPTGTDRLIYPSEEL